MAGIFLKRYRYMLAVMVGVIAGTLIANYAIMNITDKVGVLNNDFRLSIIDMKVNNVALWQYIFKTRIKELTLLILLLITPVAVPAVYIIFGIIGMSVGMVDREDRKSTAQRQPTGRFPGERGSGAQTGEAFSCMLPTSKKLPVWLSTPA